MPKNIKFSALVVGVTLASLGISTKADAAIVTVPTDLAPGSQYRLVFVTSTSTNATIPDIDYYNMFVDNTAKATDSQLKDVNTLWTAIGSTATVSAITNTYTPTSTAGIPIYLVDGSKIANDYTDLWDGSISTPINTNEKGDSIRVFVWTGSYPNGVVMDTGPYSYGLGSLSVGHGDSGSNDFWVYTGNTSDSISALNFYGMSGVLTVPQNETPTTPEPTSILGFITFGGYLLGSAIEGSQKSKVKSQK